MFKMLIVVALLEISPIEPDLKVSDVKRMESAVKSPQKPSRDLVCVVTSKSPLKEIATGKMFSMTFADEDQTCRMKAVSFNE